MKKFKRVIALVITCVLILQINAFASLVLTKETSVDLWYRVFYSDLARLYDRERNYAYNLAWPGSPDYYSQDVVIESAFLPGRSTVQDVLGSESLNLLFSEADSVYSPGLYLKDDGRTLDFYSLCEWNGFLFVAVGGPSPSHSKYTYTSADGSITTVYDKHIRTDGPFYLYYNQRDHWDIIHDGRNYRSRGDNNSIIPDSAVLVDNLVEGDNQRLYHPGYFSYDSYIYVFDLSEETWYGDCLYAKWSIEDLGLHPDSYKRQIIEDVSVDDDYIYLFLGKNTNDLADNAKAVAVFENNVDRDNPVYDDETGDVKVPSRVEPESTTSRYDRSAKEIIDNNTLRNKNRGYYESVAINGYMVSFDSRDDVSLASTTNRSSGAIFHVTDMTDVANSGVGETKIHYLDSNFQAQGDSSGMFLSQLMPLGGGRAWSSVRDPYLRSIVVDGSSIYLLVTYTDIGADGLEEYHQKVFITDWTNPLRPTLQAQIDLIDNATFNATRNSEIYNYFKITNGNGELYYYDGYFYVSSGYGLNIAKKYNDSNLLDPVKVAEFDYISSGVKSGYINMYEIHRDIFYQSPPMITAVGNCVYMNFKTRNDNRGIQVELRLSPDKTKIEELLKGDWAERNVSMTGIDQNKIVRYGSRIYIGAERYSEHGLFPARIHVLDFSAAFPVELSVDKIDATVSAPYTITGGGMGINAVQIKLNGEEMGYANIKKSSGKYGTWSYTITEPGTYTLEAVGATLVGYPKQSTAEFATFTVVASGDLTYDADINEVASGNEDIRQIIISPKITENTMSGYVDVMPAAAAYSGNTMIAVEFGEKVRIEQGETYELDPLTLEVPADYSGFTVKAFLLDGLGTYTAMSDYVEKGF